MDRKVSGGVPGVQTSAAAQFLAAAAMNSTDDVQGNSKAIALAREKAYKEKQERALDLELATMRSEREQLSATAEKITADLDEFEFRFNKSSLSSVMNRPAEEMDKLIAQINARHADAFAALETASANFERVRQKQLHEDMQQTTMTEGSADDEIKERDALTSSTSEESSPPPASKALFLDSQALGAPIEQKLSQASDKLSRIFKQVKSQYGGVVLSMSSSLAESTGISPSDGEEALVPMLSKKIEFLSKAFEMSQLKNQAMTVQWTTDRASYEDQLHALRHDQSTLTNKLKIQDARNRLNEQMQRDPNMVSNVVTRAEFEAIRSEKIAAEKELQEKSEECAKRVAELALVKAEVKKYEVDVDQMSYKMNQLQNQCDSLERKVEIGEDRLRRDAEEFENRISGMVEQAKEQAQRLRENDKAVDALKQQNNAALAAQQAEFDALQEGLNSQIADMQKQMKRKVLEQDSLQAKLAAAEEKVAVRDNDISGQLATLRDMAGRMIKLDAAYCEQRGILDTRLRRQSERISGLKSQSILVKQAGQKAASKNSKASAADTEASAAEAAAARAEVDRQRAAAVAQAKADALTKAKELLMQETLAKQRQSETQTEIQLADVEIQTASEAVLLDIGLFSTSHIELLLRDTQEENLPADSASTCIEEHETTQISPIQLAVVERSQSLNAQLVDLVHQSASTLIAMQARIGANLEDSVSATAAITSSIEAILRQVGKDQKAVICAVEQSATQALAQQTCAEVSNGTNSASGFRDDASVPTLTGTIEEGSSDQFGGLSIRQESLEELNALKAALRDGSLSNIGTVSRENFERLAGKEFGSDAIIELTRKEHLLRYDMNDDDDAATANTKDTSTAKGQLMQMQMMQMERDVLEERILSAHSLEDLARFKRNTENHILLLSSMNALRKVAYYRDGGLFLDILVVHRDVLDRCILSGGGWPVALQKVQEQGLLGADTTHWPDFFRVKVLESYRRSLMDSVAQHVQELQAAKVLAADVENEREEERRTFKRTLDAVIVELEELKQSKKKALKKGATALLLERALVSQMKVHEVEPSPAPEVAETMPETADHAAVICIPPIEAAVSVEAPEISVVLDKSITVDQKMKTAMLQMQQLEQAAPALSETPAPLVEQAATSASSLETPLLATLHAALDHLVVRMLKNDSISLCIAEGVTDAVSLWRKSYLEDAVETLVSCLHFDPAHDLPYIHTLLALIELPQCARVPREVEEIAHKLDAVLSFIDEQKSANVSGSITQNDRLQQLMTQIDELRSHGDASELERAALAAELVDLHTALDKVRVELAASQATFGQESAQLLEQISKHAEQAAAMQSEMRQLQSDKAEMAQQLREEESYGMRERMLVNDMREEVKREHEVEVMLHSQLTDAKKKIVVLETQSSSLLEEIRGLKETIANTPVPPPMDEEAEKVIEKLRGQIVNQRKGYNELDARWRAAGEEIKELKQAAVSAAAAAAESASSAAAQSTAATSVPAAVEPELKGSKGKLALLGKFKSVLDLSLEMAESRRVRQEKEKLDEEAVKERQALFDRTVTQRVEAVIKAMTPDIAECGTQTQPFAFQGIMTANVSSLAGNSKAQSIMDDSVDDNASLESLSVSLAAPFMPHDYDYDDDSLEEGDASYAKARELWIAHTPMSLPLPPGFALVHVVNQQLELCPGVLLAVPSLLPAWERALVPKNVQYCYRDPETGYSKGLKRLPKYVKAPRLEAIEAVIVPPIFDICAGVLLIQGFGLANGIEMDPDIFLVKLDKGANLPPGMTLVELLPHINVPIETKQLVPSGTELVQVNMAVSLPAGVPVCRGVEIAEMPPGMKLPFNVALIKREKGQSLPPFMMPLVSTAGEEAEIFLHRKMKRGVTIVKKPNGVVFLPGTEIITRAVGQQVPPGMSIVPLAQYPEGLILPALHDLVMLDPHIDLPDGCVVAKDWRAIPRPEGVTLPAGVSLYQYDGEHGGAGLLPPFMKAVPMPDLPHHVTLAANVLAAEFLPSVTQVLPVGSILAPGITVLRMEKYTKEIRVPLPCNAVLVHRQPGSVIPPCVERGSRSDLPAGILLEPNVEVHLLSVRFELPSGVKLDTGVTLGRGVQIAPGTILSRDLEVQRWPWGVTLSPGTELVTLLPGHELPHGYHEAATQPKLDLNPHMHHAQPVPSRSRPVVVKLPAQLDMFSALQLAEVTEVVDVEKAVSRHESEQSAAIKGVREVFSAKEVLDAMPPGTVIISRHKRSLLPSELQCVPKSSVPDVVRRFLSKKKITVRSQIRNSKDEARGGRERVTELVQCRAIYRLPAGVELAPGLHTLDIPFTLRSCMPQHQWLELVALDLLQSHPAWLQRLVTVSTAADVMPPNSALVAMPKSFSPYSWGPACAGIEAVLCPEHIQLPATHFLVQRPRRHEPPFSFGMGLSRKYHAFESSFPQLPPGVEIMHLHPYFALPHAIALESTAPLIPQSADTEMDRSITSTIQLAEGQALSPGVSTLSHPYGLFPLLVRGSAFVFVRYEDSYVLPHGAVESRDQEGLQLVKMLFQTSEVQDNVKLVALPPTLPAPRERLRDLAEQPIVDVAVISAGIAEEVDEAANAAISRNQSIGMSFGDVSKWMRQSFLMQQLDSDLPASPFLPDLDDIAEERQADSEIIFVQCSIAVEAVPPPHEVDDSQNANNGGSVDATQSYSSMTPSVGFQDANSEVGSLERFKALAQQAKSYVPPNISSSELRLRLEAVGLNTQTPGMSESDRRIELLRRLIEAENSPLAGPIGENASGAAISNPAPAVDTYTMLPDEYLAYMTELLLGKSSWASVSLPQGGALAAPSALRPGTAKSALSSTEPGQHDPSQPSQAELLRCLDLAQDEIYSLELENNQYKRDCKDQKSALARQMKKLQRLEERINQYDASASDKFLQLADLEGKVAFSEAQLKLKTDEIARIKDAGQDAKVRLQAQVDVLTKQLALWMDANAAVLKEREEFLQSMKVKQREHYRSLAKAFRSMRRQCDEIVKTTLGSLCVSIGSIFRCMQQNHKSSTNSTNALAGFIAFVNKEKSYGLHRLLPAQSGLAKYASSNVSVSGSTIATVEGSVTGAGSHYSLPPLTGPHSQWQQQQQPMNAMSLTGTTNTRTNPTEASSTASAVNAPSDVVKGVTRAPSWSRVTDSSTGAEVEVSTDQNASDMIFPPCTNDAEWSESSFPARSMVITAAIPNAANDGIGDLAQNDAADVEDPDDISLLSEASQHSYRECGGKEPEKKTFRRPSPSTHHEEGMYPDSNAYPLSPLAESISVADSYSSPTYRARQLLPMAIWPPPARGSVRDNIPHNFSSHNPHSQPMSNIAGSHPFLEDMREEFLRSVTFDPELQCEKLQEAVDKCIGVVYDHVLHDAFGEELTEADRQLFEGRDGFAGCERKEVDATSISALKQLNKVLHDDGTNETAVTVTKSSASSAVDLIQEQNEAAKAALEEGKELNAFLKDGPKVEVTLTEDELNQQTQKAEHAAKKQALIEQIRKQKQDELRALGEDFAVRLSTPPVVPQKPPVPTTLAGLLESLEKLRPDDTVNEAAENAPLDAHLNAVQAAVMSELSTWTSSMEMLVRIYSDAERDRYHKALRHAETEIRTMLAERVKCDKRLADLEVMLIKQKQRWQPNAVADLSVEETVLRNRILDLEECVERMRSAAPFNTMREFIRSCAEKIDSLKEMEQQLQHEAAAKRVEASDQDAQITLGSGVVQPFPEPERRAIHQKARSLRKEAEQYQQRAAYCKKQQREVAMAILADLEAYQRVVQDCLPKRVILDMLNWSIGHAAGSANNGTATGGTVATDDGFKSRSSRGSLDDGPPAHASSSLASLSSSGGLNQPGRSSASVSSAVSLSGYSKGSTSLSPSQSPSIGGKASLGRVPAFPEHLQKLELVSKSLAPGRAGQVGGMQVGLPNRFLVQSQHNSSSDGRRGGKAPKM